MTTTTDKSVQQAPGGSLPRTKTPESLFWLIEDLLSVGKYDTVAVFYDGSGFADYLMKNENVKFVGNETNFPDWNRIYAFPPFYQKAVGNKETSNIKLVQNVQRGAEDHTGDFIQEVLRGLCMEGKAVIMVSNSLFTRNYAELQKRLIADRSLIKVINLPFGAVYPKNVSASLLVFYEGIDNYVDNEGVLFVDLRAFASGQSEWSESQKTFEKLNERDKSVIKRIVWSGHSEYSQFVTYEEIVKADYNLNSNFYIGNASMADEHKPFVLGNEAQIFRGVQDKQGGCHLVLDEDPSACAEKYECSYWPRYLRISDIQSSRIQNTMLYIVDGEDHVDKKFRLRIGDVVISKTALPMKFALFVRDDDDPVFPAGNIFVIRMNEGSKLNPFYLKSYMESEEGNVKLLSLSSGSALVSFTKEGLSRFEIPYLSPIAQAELEEDYMYYEDEIKRLGEELFLTKQAQLDLYKRFAPSNSNRRAPEPDPDLPPSSPDPGRGQTAPQAGAQSEPPQTSGGEAGPKSPA